MKSFRYMCAALGALLYGCEVYGHYTLNVFEQINKTFKTQPKNETEINDTNTRWEKANEGLNLHDHDQVIVKIDDFGCLCLNDEQLLDCQLNKYDNWKHDIITFDDKNQIELWWTGDKEMNTVVVTETNLNIPCYIKADNVFLLGSNCFAENVTIAAENVFSNLGDFITQNGRIFTHHGTNFGYMGHEAPSEPNRIIVGINEADRMFYKMPLDDNQSINSLASILKSDGFTDFGISMFDNVTTEDINFNTYGNTMVNKFTQNGNHRNMSVMDFLPIDWLFPWFYRMYFHPCQEFGVTINDLSGTNLLSIMGGKIIGPNIYSDNNQKVSIKVSSKVVFDPLEERKTGEDYEGIEQYWHKLLLNVYGKPYDKTIWHDLHWKEPKKIENKNIWEWSTVFRMPGYASYGMYIIGAQIFDDWFFYHKVNEAVVPFSYAVDYYLSQKLKQEGKLPIVNQAGQGDQDEQDRLTEPLIEEEEEIEDNPSNQEDQNEQGQLTEPLIEEEEEEIEDNPSNNNSLQQDVRLDLNTTVGHLNKIQKLAKQFDQNGGHILMPDATGLRNVANAGTKKEDRQNKKQDNK